MHVVAPSRDIRWIHGIAPSMQGVLAPVLSPGVYRIVSGAALALNG